MSNIPIIEVDNVSKKYAKTLRSSLWYGIKDIGSELLIRRSGPTNVSLRSDEFWSLQNVSFELMKGQSIAIIGDNGAGKSTLLKLIYGLIRPDSGRIVLRGKVGAIIELGAGLDPVLTGRENIYLKAALFGYSKNEVNSMLDQIIDFAGVGDFIDTPVQFYSSGMSSRLAFAVTTHLKPDILLVDEVLAVGDMDFQRKCINHMLNYISSGGSIILVSHNPNHIQAVCQRGILLENGVNSFEGTSIETLDRYFKNQLSKISFNKTTTNDNNLRERKSMIIEEVILEPIQGETIQSNQDCRLKVKYVTTKSFENISWGLSIWTHDNIVNISGNYDLTPRTIKAEEGELSCLIPKLPLAPGTYLLKIAIGELDSLQPLALMGWQDSPLEFKVEVEPNFLNNILYLDNQLMTINVQWD